MLSYILKKSCYFSDHSEPPRVNGWGDILRDIVICFLLPIRWPHLLLLSFVL